LELPSTISTGKLRNSWRRMIEEDAATDGKIWRKVKVIAGNKSTGGPVLQSREKGIA
jgi:hypothetical protein